MSKYSQVSKKKVKMDGGGKTKRKRKKYLKKTRKKQRGGLVEEIVFMTGIFTLLSIAMCCVAAPFLMALQLCGLHNKYRSIKTIWSVNKKRFRRYR